MPHQRVLFCNVAWMTSYRGKAPGEILSSGGSYVVNHGTGHEIGNFLPYRQRLYGFVRPTKGSAIRLDRIDPTGIPGEVLDGVTVIWTAKRPEGGKVVVGWYKNARVHARWKKHTGYRASFFRPHGLIYYLLEASVYDSFLMPMDHRRIPIPRAKRGHSGMGQSNIWYAEGERDKPWFIELMLLIGRNGTFPSSDKQRTKDSPRQLDPKKRRAIEQAAIRAVMNYYENGGDFSVISVEAESKGWDLECRRGDLRLRVEVKGTSLADFSVELTPNEYASFKVNDADFRVAVVTNALTEPHLQIFAFSREQNTWVTDEGVALQVEERMSAVLRQAEQ